MVFGVSFLLFPVVQDYIRPNYDGSNELIVYLLGVAPNFLPGIGLPALLYVVIPEVFNPNNIPIGTSIALKALPSRRVRRSQMIFYQLAHPSNQTFISVSPSGPSAQRRSLISLVPL